MPQGKPPTIVITEQISYGQFYVLSLGHTEPEAPDISDLVDAAIDRGGFAKGLGTLVAIVPELPDGHGQLELDVTLRADSPPHPKGSGYAWDVDVDERGLSVGTVDGPDRHIDVPPGRYNLRLTPQASPSPETVTHWALDVCPTAAPVPTTLAKRQSSQSKEKKRERVAKSLHTLPRWDLTRIRLDDEYNEILADVAPAVTSPVLVNLFRTGIRELPHWLTRIPMLVGLLAHENDLESLPAWLPELRHLQQLAVSDNPRLREIPDSLAQLQLNRLEIDGTGLDHIPEVVSRLNRLELLDISGLALTTIPDWLGVMPSLRRLHLRKSPVSQLPDSIRERLEAGTLTLHR